MPEAGNPGSVRLAVPQIPVREDPETSKRCARAGVRSVR